RTVQRQARLRGVGRGNQEAEQESAPDVGSARQSEHREFLRHCERLAKENAGEATRDGQSQLIFLFLTSSFHSAGFAAKPFAGGAEVSGAGAGCASTAAVGERSFRPCP